MTSASDVVFDGIDQSLRPSKDSLERLFTRADEVANALMDSGLCVECRVVGSATRSTALSGYSDIDLIAIADLKGGSRKDSQRAIADLEAALTAANFTVETDKFAVSVKFDRPPAVDVMPAICRDGGVGYLIPTGHDADWQDFFPDRLKELTERSMYRLGSRFGVVVRLLKLWNRSRGAGFKSSDLEELASVALDGRDRASSYSQHLMGVLALALEWVSDSPGANAKMGRSFSSVGRDGWMLRIIQDSMAAASEMQDAEDELTARRLAEVFFGGEFAESVH